MQNAQRIVVVLIILTNSLWFNCRLFAQYNNAQIDSLFEISKLLRRQGEFVKAGTLYNRLLVAAKKNKYAKGLAESYLRIANLKTVQGNYTISNLYLDSAQMYVQQTNDPWSKTTLYAERGKNFYFLGLIESSFQSLNKALEVARAIADKNIRNERMAYIYEYQSLAFEKIHQQDSAFFKVKLVYNTRPTPVMARRISWYYLRQYGQPDSAEKYLSIAKDLVATGRFNIHSNSLVLRVEGILEFERQNFTKAVQVYQQSIAISRQLGIKEEEMVTNRLLSAAYKALGDKAGMATSLERYIQLSDSLSADAREAAQKSVKKLLEEKEQAGKSALIKLYGSIAIFILIGSVIFSWVTVQSRRRLAKRDAELTRKDKVIEESMKKQEMLSQKLNESFSELVKLARHNDPNFYPRFNEVYPEVKVALLNMVPGLRITELTLAAYIYLNFSTKDIAEYTFTSTRTVQTRKSNLRKKLGVSTYEDLYVWMKNLRPGNAE